MVTLTLTFPAAVRSMSRVSLAILRHFLKIFFLYSALSRNLTSILASPSA